MEIASDVVHLGPAIRPVPPPTTTTSTPQDVDANKPLWLSVRRVVRADALKAAEVNVQMEPRLILAFTFVDLLESDGRVHSFNDPLRFELLINGQVRYLTTRNVTGKLSRQEWTVVLPRDLVLNDVHSISPRVVLPRKTNGNTSVGELQGIEIVGGFQGTDKPEGAR